MKRIAVVVVLLGLIGCSKDEDEPRSAGTSLSTCSQAVTIHEGAVADNTCIAPVTFGPCQNFNQSVSVPVDPITHVYDKVEVYQCSPSNVCTAAPGASYATGHNEVSLVNWWALKTSSGVYGGQTYDFVTSYRIVATQCR